MVLDLHVDAIDGSRFRVEGMRAKPDFIGSMATVSGLFDGELDATPKGQPTELVENPDVCSEFQFTERLSHSGGHVRAGSGYPAEFQQGTAIWEQARDGTWRRQQLHMAVWEGESWAAKVHRYGGELSETLDSLLAFEYDESPQGVVATPVDGLIRFAGSAWVRLRFPDIGWVELAPHGHPEAPPRPGHAGTQVVGGELYRGDGRDHEHFVLMSDTAATTVLAGHGTSSSLEALLESLSVSVEASPKGASR